MTANNSRVRVLRDGEPIGDGILVDPRRAIIYNPLGLPAREDEKLEVEVVRPAGVTGVLSGTVAIGAVVGRHQVVGLELDRPVNSGPIDRWSEDPDNRPNGPTMRMADLIANARRGAGLAPEDDDPDAESRPWYCAIMPKWCAGRPADG